MNVLEFLDRRHERKIAYRAQLPYRPLDLKLLVGTLFFAGYYALVYLLVQRAIPGPNGPLVRDSLLVLGPAIGVIVGALFRSDRRDEEQTRNTGEAFRAVTAQAHATSAAANAGTGDGLNAGDRPSGAAGDPVHVEQEGKL